ncbi:hypothetical protein [Streptomyces sp. SPB162]|uniref:hypothetical protein n=1 Tax=Streptomyces sp. SPB162 TaxID=2940560 RepID=UPI002406C6EE|nr:hypothetical protein [Streptomyces sp. SPB162]MDF9811824.1 hypothetical protein [Streptomyces sp. SPB162]
MPVGELVAGPGEVGTDDAKVLVSEAAQPPGDVRVGRLAESVVEVGGGGEDFLERGEDAVVGGDQLGQRVGCLVRGDGLANPLGDVGDGGAQRQVAGRTRVGVVVRVAVDVVTGRSQAGDGVGGETGLLVLREAGGGAVVGLVDADDGDEARALEDAVRLGVAAAGEEFVGVRVVADVQEGGRCGAGRRFSYGDRWALCRTAAGAGTARGWPRRVAVVSRFCWMA